MYRTVSTIVTDLESGGATLRAAAATAAAMEAHLDVLCVGIDWVQPAAYFTGTDAFPIEDTLGEARAAAARLEGDVRDRLADTPRSHVSAAAVPVAGISTLVARHTQFADMTILPKPYGGRRRTEDVAIVEAALFAGNAPVLVLPEAHDAAVHPRRAVVAWNESREALRAIRFALPLLRQCERSWVAIVNPSGQEGEAPGAGLAEMLRRHDVAAEVEVLTKPGPKVSEALTRFALDCEADLVVMGAYGHSRMREAVLGGATRQMLEKVELPTLMAR